MKSIDLLEQLKTNPENTVIASVDINTGVLDKHGDEICAKVFAHSICDVYNNSNETVIHFELSDGDCSTLNVIDIVTEAAKKNLESFAIHSVHKENKIQEYASANQFTVRKAGVKRAGGEIIMLKKGNDIHMSFVRLTTGYQRVF